MALEISNALRRVYCAQIQGVWYGSFNSHMGFPPHGVNNFWYEFISQFLTPYDILYAYSDHSPRVLLWANPSYVSNFPLHAVVGSGLMSEKKSVIIFLILWFDPIYHSTH